MLVLKKIKSSTLIENLVATVIILVIFMLTSSLLSNMFLNVSKSDYNTINSRLNIVEYKLIHKGITVHYYEEYEGWEVSINSNNNIAEIVAKNKTSKKEILRKIEIKP